MDNNDFTRWFNDADIPVQDANGNWYDCENGSYFIESISKPVKKEKTATEERYDKLKIAELKEIVARYIASQEYAINKAKGLGIELPASIKVIESYKNITRVTKAKLYAIIDLNVYASQQQNILMNK